MAEADLATLRVEVSNSGPRPDASTLRATKNLGKAPHYASLVALRLTHLNILGSKEFCDQFVKKARLWISVSLATIFALYAANIVAGQIFTSHRPMWIEPVDIRTIGPDRAFELEFHDQQVSFFIPKGERADVGTFTITSSQGRCITNIPRPGKFESFYRVSGGFMFLIRDERSDWLSAVLVEPVGLDYQATQVTDPSSAFAVGRLKDAHIRVWSDRMVASFDGDAMVEYDFSSKEWRE